MLSIDDVDDEITGGFPDVATDQAPAVPMRDGIVDPLTPGSPVARALYLAWSGQPVTVVDSPPGAGKSALITQVVSHIFDGSDMVLAVATPTRRQAIEIALRIKGRVPGGTVWLKLGNLTAAETPAGQGLAVEELKLPTNPNAGKKTVMVSTLASMKFSKPDVDVLIVDEAYQCTFADVLTVAGGARQVLLVGDPGQIGPVVTVSTRAWDRLPNAPHLRAPEVFSARSDAEIVNLPCTYRFGADTVTAIAPLYDFPFTSARPTRCLHDTAEVESIKLFGDIDPHSIAILGEVAARAVSMVGRRLTAHGQDDRDLIEQDVAVVVSHNAQVGIVRGHLSAMGRPDITVGTADKLQGGQWEAVIALDPLTGAVAVESHAASLGRLCVMASRHRTHLTFFHDGAWSKLLANSDLSVDERDRHIAVRERLTAS